MKWLLVFLMLPFLSQAQLYDVGIGVGGAVYAGDLSSPSLEAYVRQSHAAGQISAAYYFSNAYSLRGHLMYSKLSGDDQFGVEDWQVQRDLNFETSLMEVGVQIEADFGRFFNLPIGISYPYGFIGMTVLHFNPMTYYNGSKIALQPLGTEGQGMQGYDAKYSLMTTAFNFGLGYKYPVRDYVDLVFSLAWRRTATDYLDDVSKNYVSREELSANNGEIAALLGNKINRETGRVRGGKYSKDWYGVGLISLRYYLGKDRKRMRRHKPGYTGSCPSKF